MINALAQINSVRFQRIENIQEKSAFTSLVRKRSRVQSSVWAPSFPPQFQIDTTKQWAPLRPHHSLNFTDLSLGGLSSISTKLAQQKRTPGTHAVIEKQASTYTQFIRFAALGKGLFSHVQGRGKRNGKEIYGH